VPSPLSSAPKVAAPFTGLSLFSQSPWLLAVKNGAAPAKWTVPSVPAGCERSKVVKHAIDEYVPLRGAPSRGRPRRGREAREPGHLLTFSKAAQRPLGVSGATPAACRGRPRCRGNLRVNRRGTPQMPRRGAIRLADEDFSKRRRSIVSQVLVATGVQALLAILGKA